ncbi:MAG: DsbA family protein [Gammaproteobacteria bacterium]|nr:DsbA family protein [Gammaproteobacteria bacterium]MCK5092056.1 DsbA family protein [Gammaproteobacteria bacterium]
MNKIIIEYFSDVLCVWSYGGQIRIDELKKKYPGKLEFHYRFLPLFSSTANRMTREWGHRGHYSGFNKHLQGVMAQWDHLEMHPDVWLKNVPASSVNAHLYLTAIRILENNGVVSKDDRHEFQRHNLFEETIWRIREAFFRHNLNIADIKVLDSIANDLHLPVDQIRQLIDTGEAQAELCLDFDAKETYQVPGSPTFIFNSGRQRLYGNVGYRILEANFQELLLEDDINCNEPSWC